MSTARHPHAHGSRDHPRVGGGTRLTVALGAVLALFVVELVVGLRAHSLALVSDAGHLVTDTGTLAMAAFAISRSRRPATARHTFGHHRAGILVAAINGAALLGVAGSIAVAAVTRLHDPVAVDAVPVIIVAVLACCVNVGLAVILGGGDGELSTRSAMLHVLGDALASAGVVVSSVIIVTTGLQTADPAVSLCIAALIAVSAVHLLRETLRILAESAPSDVDSDAVRAAIAATSGITDVHDLHIWSLSRNHRALTAHVSVPDGPLSEVTLLLHRLEMALCADFNIEHATLQAECPTCLDGAPLYCDLTERHSLVHATTTEPD